MLYALPGALCLSSCSTKEDMKDTAEKVKATTIEASYMDTTVRPQDDFFKFCNGNWVKNNPVPATESRWGSFNELDQANKVKLRGIMEDAAKAHAAKGSTQQIIGDFFTSYMDSTSRNKKGYEPIKADLNVIQEAKDIIAIQGIIAKQHKEGIGSLFSFGVDQDLKNVDVNMLYTGQGGLGLPNKTYYLDANKADIRDAYIKHIDRMLKMCAMDNSTERAKQIFELEKKLAEVSMAPEEMREPERTYNKYARADFEKACPNFNWAGYYSVMNGVQFDTIIVGQPVFLQGMNTLLKSVPLETWKDYLTWNLINTYASHLSDDFVQADFDFYNTTLSGVKEMKPRYERVANELTNLPIGQALGKLFVEKYFSENAKKKINVLVDNLTSAFRERLETRDWMSGETKAKAIEKLNAIHRKLAFPDKWEDFSKIAISADNYLSNYKNVVSYSINKNLNKLHKPVDREEWGMPPHMVNAYYHPLLNEIAFPAGIMQPPFFDENADDAINYSRIGMVIGHELTHGFDDMGSKFAADGSFTNWWTPEDRKLFEARTKILGETFAKFCPFEGICVNPELTMGENIADLGGVTISYYAFKKTAEFKENKSVDGYTPSQRFFISYGQLWKINFKDEELKKRLATDPHSPGMYRINGPLKNCPEFYKAFNVQPGDGMYNEPDKMAIIW